MKEEIYRCEAVFASRFSRSGSVPLTDGWRLMFGQRPGGSWGLFVIVPFHSIILPLTDAPLWLRREVSMSLRDLFRHLLFLDRDIEETTTAFKSFADQHAEEKRDE